MHPVPTQVDRVRGGRDGSSARLGFGAEGTEGDLKPQMYNVGSKIIAAPGTMNGRRPWYAALGVGSAVRVPRAGLAQALAVHVARGFGTRRPRNVLRGFTYFLETYNDELYNGHTDTDAVTRRLAARTLGWWRSIESLARKQSEFVAHTWARFSESSSHYGDSTIPECVIFLRATIGAGAVAADIPEDIFFKLDQFAIALGLDWEATQGTLDGDGWHAGLLALGVTNSGDIRSELPGDAGARARRYARTAIASLPCNKATAQLAALLEHPPLEMHSGLRKHLAYTPYFPTLPNPEPSAAYLSSGITGSFVDRWRPRLETALEKYAASDSSAFSHAAAYLMMQRGKRIRGLLTLAAAAACGHDPARALESAAAVEWIHQASLVLDDIVDRTDMRRGSPALHSITSPVFAAATTAFLLGKRLDARCNLSRSASAVLLDAELSLLKGECLELCGTSPAHRTISAYYRTIEAKTARLFSCAASLGALSTERSASKAQVNALAKYGREIGLAFQIVDDLRDYASNPAALGKRVGTDFDNGLATLPLLLLEKATEIPSGADFDWIREAMKTCSIPEACLARAQRHVDAGLLAIKGLPNREGIEVLEHIAETTLAGGK